MRDRIHFNLKVLPAGISQNIPVEKDSIIDPIRHTYPRVFRKGQQAKSQYYLLGSLKADFLPLLLTSLSLAAHQ